MNGNPVFNGLRYIISRLHNTNSTSGENDSKQESHTSNDKKILKKRKKNQRELYSDIDGSTSSSNDNRGKRKNRSKLKSNNKQDDKKKNLRHLKTPKPDAIQGITPGQAAATPWNCCSCGHKNEAPGKVHGVSCIQCGASRKFKRRRLSESPTYSGILNVGNLRIDLSWSWQKIWAILKSKGGWNWAKSNGLSSSYIYLMPGVKKSTGVKGVSMFESYREVMNYLEDAAQQQLSQMNVSGEDDHGDTSDEEENEDVEPPITPPDTKTSGQEHLNSTNYGIIDLNDSWPNIYYLLKQCGWKYCSADRNDLQNDYYYLAPNAPKSKRECTFGKNIFRNQDAVKEYIRKLQKNGNGSSENGRSISGNSSSNSNNDINNHISDNDTSGDGRDSNAEGMEEEEEEESERGVEDSEEEEEEEDYGDFNLINVDDSWANTFYLLKQSGWKYCSGDNLEPYFYMVPGEKKSTAIFGKSIFRNPSAVIKYIRKRKNLIAPIGTCKHCKTKIYEDWSVHESHCKDYIEYQAEMERLTKEKEYMERQRQLEEQSRQKVERDTKEKQESFSQKKHQEIREKEKEKKQKLKEIERRKRERDKEKEKIRKQKEMERKKLEKEKEKIRKEKELERKKVEMERRKLEMKRKKIEKGKIRKEKEIQRRKLEKEKEKEKIRKQKEIQRIKIEKEKIRKQKEMERKKREKEKEKNRKQIEIEKERKRREKEITRKKKETQRLKQAKQVEEAKILEEKKVREEAVKVAQLKSKEIQKSLKDKQTKDMGFKSQGRFHVKSKKNVLDLNDSFGNIWFLLKQDGWTHATGNALYSWFYLKPGITKRTGKLGVNMFCTEQDVIDHCRIIGMHGQKLDLESSTSSESEDKDDNEQLMTSIDDNDETGYTMAGIEKSNRKMQNIEKNGALKASVKVVNSDKGKVGVKKTKAKSLHNNKSNTAISSKAMLYLYKSNFNLSQPWRDLWEDLASVGWKWHVGIGDFKYMYLQPGANINSGKLGVDMFCSEKDVTEHLRRSFYELAKKHGDEEERYEAPGITSESQLDLNEPWNNIWYLLKQGGWKWASGDMFNPYYYLKPSVVNKGSGILGVDMFACPADVVKHLKNISSGANSNSGNDGGSSTSYSNSAKTGKISLVAKRNDTNVNDQNKDIHQLMERDDESVPKYLNAGGIGEVQSTDRIVGNIHDALDFLCARWPGRSEAIQTLASLVGEGVDWALPLLLVSGSVATGKTLLVQDFFRLQGVNHMYVDCANIHRARDLFEQILDQVDDNNSNSNAVSGIMEWDSDGEDKDDNNTGEFHTHDTGAAATKTSDNINISNTLDNIEDKSNSMNIEHVSGAVESSRRYRCDKTSMFLQLLKQILNIDSPSYLIFDNAEKLQTLGRSILPIFSRLQETSECNVGVVMIAQTAWESFDGK